MKAKKPKVEFPDYEKRIIVHLVIAAVVLLIFWALLPVISGAVALLSGVCVSCQ